MLCKGNFQLPELQLINVLLQLLIYYQAKALWKNGLDMELIVNDIC